MSKEAFVDPESQGKVMGIPGPLVDSLRTVSAFKPGQGWYLYRQPASLIRQEAVEFAQMMAAIEEGTASELSVSRVIHGGRKTGKSVLLLQAMASAFLRNWVVINFSERKFVLTT